MNLKKFTYLFMSLATAFIILSSNDNGKADKDRTDSGTGGCSDNGTCHAATTSSGNVVVLVKNSADAIVSSYIPGQKYKIEIILTGAQSTSAGFQSTLLSAANVTPGTVAADIQTVETKVVQVGGKALVTHKTDDVTAIKTGNTVTWKYSWTAPAIGQAIITINAIVNNANNNNGESGDIIETAATLLQQSVGVNDIQSEAFSVKAYPNPTTDQLNLEFTAQTKGAVYVFDMMGHVLIQHNFQGMQTSLATSQLANGTYFYKVIIDGKSVVRHFVKK